jgi:hypothetical protein
MLPTSIRFIYYELISRETISKVRTGARRTDQDTIDAITKLREDGDVQWEDIEDETRSLDDHTGWNTIRAAALSRINHARLDPWGGSAPMIITESRSLAGVLQGLASEYAVHLASTNGQCAGFLHTKLAPALCDGDRVLYLGDWDFAGGHIERNSKRVLEQDVGELDWTRLAVTERQITTYHLTVIQKYDNRTKHYHDAVEAEALGQERIVNIVRARLRRMLPQPLTTVHEREEEEREAIRRILEAE